MGFEILFKEVLPLLNHQSSLIQAIEVVHLFQLPLSIAFEYMTMFPKKWEHISLIMSDFEPLIEIFREQEKPHFYTPFHLKETSQSRSISYTRHIHLQAEDQAMKMPYLAAGSGIQEKVDLDAIVSLTFVIVFV